MALSSSAIMAKAGLAGLPAAWGDEFAALLADADAAADPSRDPEQLAADYRAVYAEVKAAAGWPDLEPPVSPAAVKP